MYQNILESIPGASLHCHYIVLFIRIPGIRHGVGLLCCLFANIKGICWAWLGSVSALILTLL